MLFDNLIEKAQSNDEIKVEKVIVEDENVEFTKSANNDNNNSVVDELANNFQKNTIDDDKNNALFKMKYCRVKISINDNNSNHKKINQ